MARLTARDEKKLSEIVHSISDILHDSWGLSVLSAKIVSVNYPSVRDNTVTFTFGVHCDLSDVLPDVDKMPDLSDSDYYEAEDLFEEAKGKVEKCLAAAARREYFDFGEASFALHEFYAGDSTLEFICYYDVDGISAEEDLAV